MNIQYVSITCAVSSWEQGIQRWMRPTWFFTSWIVNKHKLSHTISWVIIKKLIPISAFFFCSGFTKEEQKTFIFSLQRKEGQGWAVHSPHLSAPHPTPPHYWQLLCFRPIRGIRIDCPGEASKDRRRSKQPGWRRVKGKGGMSGPLEVAVTKPSSHPWFQGGLGRQNSSCVHVGGLMQSSSVPPTPGSKPLTFEMDHWRLCTGHLAGTRVDSRIELVL